MEEAPSLQKNSAPKNQQLTTEKTLIGMFVFFVTLSILLMVVQSKWYYFTFGLSLVVLLVTYKEGLTAMEDEE